ncbi:MAG: F0F1 ATP synthase subunit A, partial [Proteobacteria bacterium]|nr:F0F1 ATP synthase subunit A [Pseudomonadota bacterium]
ENIESATVVTSIGIASTLIILGSLVAVRNLNSSSNALQPEKKLTIRTLFELLSEFIVWLGDTAMGKEHRKYLPFVGSLFVFILCMNLLGLIPGLSVATDRISVNAGLAVTVFILYNAWGIRDVGIINFLKHMSFYDSLRPNGLFLFLVLGSLLFVLEAVSYFIRPLTLTLRLFGNMTGDHMVLGIFTDLTRNIFVPAPVIFYCLGTIVCIIQAFVFTLLTMIYIRLACTHEGSHDEEHH